MKYPKKIYIGKHLWCMLRYRIESAYLLLLSQTEGTSWFTARGASSDSCYLILQYYNRNRRSNIKLVPVSVSRASIISLAE
jgi:hypothetical protein